MLDIIVQLRKWREHIPDLHNGAYRRTWDKAFAKKSMRAAVNAKCQDCMCWQSAEIRNCTVVTCPLWQYRPNQGKAEKADCEVVRGNASQIH